MAGSDVGATGVSPVPPGDDAARLSICATAEGEGSAACFPAVGFFSPSGCNGAGDFISSAMLNVYRHMKIGRTSYWESFLLTVLTPGRLKAFDKVANAQCVGFAMTMTCNRVGASGRFDQNVRPQNARRNLHRCYLGSGNAFFAAAEHPPFYPSDSQRIDYNPSREKKVSLGPAAGAETLIWGGCAEICRVWSRRSYTHSSAPFFHIHTYPTMRIARKIRISIRPKTPRDLNLTAHGKRKIVSTSNTTNSMAMM